MITAATIEQIEILKIGNTCLVRSQSEPEQWHEVRNQRCDCAGFSYRGRCRHVQAVGELMLRQDASERDELVQRAEVTERDAQQRPHNPDDCIFLGHYTDARRKRDLGIASDWELDWLDRYAHLDASLRQATATH